MNLAVLVVGVLRGAGFVAVAAVAEKRAGDVENPFPNPRVVTRKTDPTMKSKA